MTNVSRPFFTRSRNIWLRLVCLSIFFVGTVTGLAQKPARLSDTPETALLNSLWDQSLAAGNFDDWYRNCDSWHSAIRTNDYPQLKPNVIIAGYSFQVMLYGYPPPTIIGNASLGHGGMWGLTRHDGMTSITADSVYVQYRTNQHYFYPAAYCVRDNERDMIFAMYPYASQTIGKSGSEKDELRKFFHTLAAFKPAVKPILVDNNILIPTLQMVWRRTRVADDAAYLTGEAHPSAFDDNPNNVAMIQLANAINTDDIPPMIQLSVVREDFGVAHPTRFNEPNRTERRFTTPAAIARIHYGIEHTKRIVVDASGSFDVNGRPLTWHFVPLRGAPGSVRINPLNTEGSLVEIEFDHQAERLVDWVEGQTSSLAIVGAFAHNGVYYSAPGFITSYSPWNETRVYDSNKLLQEITYRSSSINYEVHQSINSTISGAKTWNKDIYSHDLNNRLFGWTRVAGNQHTRYSAEGLLIHEHDEYGRPSVVGEVSYRVTDKKTYVSPRYEEDDWRGQLAYGYSSLATGTGQTLTRSFSSGITAEEVSPPASGSLTKPTTIPQSATVMSTSRRQALQGLMSFRSWHRTLQHRPVPCIVYVLWSVRRTPRHRHPCRMSKSPA